MRRATSPRREPLTLEALERKRDFMAGIVSVPEWEIHLPVFERLDAACAEFAARSAALERARKIARTPR